MRETPPMSASKSKRRRGVVLSLQGEQKLREAIAHVESEENFGQKLTLEELGDRTGLDPGTVAKILDCEQRVDRRTCDRFFRAFKLKLEAKDFEQPSVCTEDKLNPSVGSLDKSFNIQTAAWQ